MKFPLFVRLLLVIAGFTAASTVIAAENLNTVRARMEQRLGTLNELKDRGAAGENNRGFLEARGAAAAADQKVMAAENADRRAVYADIAARTGATADSVGRQRAQQLASLARRGHWIQDANGAWIQKS